jgi:2-dehydro-3-deoxyphosphogluconate aldolase/(4S)-4-hydroxy-2-oxoglutarate aldolase
MTSRIETLLAIERERVVAVVRMDDASELGRVVDALAEGHVHAVEITVTIPRALDQIPRALDQIATLASKDAIIGVGSVLDAETARLAILAGARFVVAPTFNASVVEMCHRYDVVAVPGAFTPTEIASAWDAGADIVKIFPAGRLGPSYLKDLLAPLPHVRLMPTGGVNVENASAFLAAGAFAVGIGGDLVPRDLERITERARKITRAVHAESV